MSFLGYAKCLKPHCAALSRRPATIEHERAARHQARRFTRQKHHRAHDFIKLTDAELRAVGFSGQKANYGRSIARAVLDGTFSFRSVARMDDEAAIAEMVKLKGIGRWSAEIYLLFALRRPDLWPVDDLGVMLGYAALKKLPPPIAKAQLMAAGEALRPWRSVAARLLWHYYGMKREGLLVE